MKRIVSLLLLLTLAIGMLAACNPLEVDVAKINIGVMSGPTGMGMAKLMSEHGDNSDRYAFEIYSAPTDATADLISGDLDMLCLPTNTAATLAAKHSELLSVIAVNTLGSLYLLTDADNQINSIADLEGETIYASVPSTTKPIIEYLLKENGVNATVEFEADHDALVARVKNGTASIAVLPEPKATVALKQNSAYSVDLNLSAEWDKVSETPLTMGCIVVRNDFLKENKKSVDVFLSDYKESIEYINTPANLESSAQMIVDGGVLPQLPIAKGALSNLYGSIVYLDGAEMKSALEGFYTAIGLSLPSDAFYYEK